MAVSGQGNLLESRKVNFDIEGELEAGGHVIPASLLVNLSVRVWGPREVERGYYSLAVEVIRERGELRIFNRSIKLGGENPGILYEFCPTNVLYLTKPCVELEGYLELNVNGSDVRQIYMRHDDGRVVLIPIRGPVNLTITPCYATNLTISWKVLTKEARLASWKLSKACDNPIYLEIGYKSPAGSAEKTVGTSEANLSLNQSGSLGSISWVMIAVILVIILLLAWMAFKIGP